MAVDILYNGINPAQDRPLLEKSVIDAIGERRGQWKAWLTQGSDGQGFSIRVDGPDGVRFSYPFLKPDERSPEFVQAKIRQGLQRVNGKQTH